MYALEVACFGGITGHRVRLAKEDNRVRTFATEEEADEARREFLAYHSKNAHRYSVAARIVPWTES